jgi:hypothetical protein
MPPSSSGSGGGRPIVGEVGDLHLALAALRLYYGNYGWGPYSGA